MQAGDVATRAVFAALSLAALAAGCAEVPPERAERDRRILPAVKPCEEQYPSIRMNGVSYEGRLNFEYRPTDYSARDGFSRCANDAITRALPRKNP